MGHKSISSVTKCIWFSNCFWFFWSWKISKANVFLDKIVDLIRKVCRFVGLVIISIVIILVIRSSWSLKSIIRNYGKLVHIFCKFDFYFIRNIEIWILARKNQFMTIWFRDPPIFKSRQFEKKIFKIFFCKKCGKIQILHLDKTW